MFAYIHAYMLACKFACLQAFVGNRRLFVFLDQQLVQHAFFSIGLEI